MLSVHEVTTAYQGLVAISAVSIEAAKISSATLGGTVISADPCAISIWREIGRLPVTGIRLTAGERQIWDDRFWVSYDGPPETTVTIPCSR